MQQPIHTIHIINKEAQGIKPRFGSVRGVNSINKDGTGEKTTPTQFLETPTRYQISSGYIYPIFGAFRSLLKFDEESGEVSWLFDPIEMWKEVGTSLVQNTFEASNNPQMAGILLLLLEI